MGVVSLALIRIGGRWVERPSIDLGAELRRITFGNEEDLMLFSAAVFALFELALGAFLRSIGMGGVEMAGGTGIVRLFSTEKA